MLLAESLEPASNAGGELKELADRIVDMKPYLSWQRRQSTSQIESAAFANGHANSLIVGPGGIENRKDVWVGLSLLAPDVRYPNHGHPPEEVYLLLTEGRFCQEEQKWCTVGVGGTFYNRPNIIHAMSSPKSTPLLAVWCLLA